MDDTLKNLKEQHFNNYKKAILEIVKNNSNVLVDEDIMSLFRKPPLDSMDLIKSKCLDLAKKNKLVIDVTSLDNMLDKYRTNLFELCDCIKKTRILELEKVINKFTFEKDTTIIKINKKDFNELNKIIKKFLKENISSLIEKNVISNINTLFKNDISEIQFNKFYEELKKYLNNSYQKQLLENVDFKILVKDTILTNNIKEQGERHIFTLNNSRIFKSDN